MLSSRFAARLRLAPRHIVRAASSSSSVPTPSTTAPPTPAAQPAQAPNYPAPWSTNQRARPSGTENARFEQTAMELQPNPLSAMELIANEPVRVVHGRKAVCDGGDGPLGHPKIFINLDKAGPKACGGLRYEQAPHHGHEH
ncbi:hypothetical protein OF83DRAFT_1168491 [Amylostereum chailletii]|nr:hypothetical protein OF83DRAFT_1168491 [Amylostereum chailletii]